MRPARLPQVLKELHDEGKLCLFVGAGISKSCGLPDWNELSIRVIEEAWPDRNELGDVFRMAERSARFKYTPLDAMRMARHKLGLAFNSAIYQCLYKQQPVLSPTVRAIADLKNITRVICTNYDDVLEEAYTARGAPFKSLVPGDQLPVDDHQLLILHPHGFLPREIKPDEEANGRITISEDDYHELYATPYSWPNIIQLNLLLSFHVLFVGCSVADPNLRRLLDLSQRIRPRDHFALMRNPDYQLKLRPDTKKWWAEVTSFQKRVETENLTARGVTPIWYEDHNEVAGFFTAIVA